MREGIETIGEFVVSRSEAAELFEAIEESLDEVECLVGGAVDFAWRIPVAGWRDDGLSTGRLDDSNQGIAVVALVGEDRVSGYGLDQGGTLGDVGHLAGGQDPPDGITQCFDTGMNLGGQLPPRAADRLITTVFWVRRPRAGGRERWWRR